MIEMGFFSFLWLLIIAIVVSLVLYYVPGVLGVPRLRIRLPGGYPATLIIAWIGAWLGTPVFGRWLEGLIFNDVAIVPAILGSVAAIFLMDACAKCCGSKRE